MSAKASPWIGAVLWLVVVLLAARFMWTSLDVRTRRSDGFAAYYTSARLLRQGEGGPRLYDDAWFGARVAAFVPGVRDIFNANPPTTAMMVLPLSSANYVTARTMWIGLSILLLGASLILIVRETRLKGVFAPIFVAAALASQPVAANQRQGQAYLLLLGLAVLFWIGNRRRRPGLAGASLSAMLVMKTAGALLPALLLLRKSWGALAWCVVTTAAVCAISLVWMGPGTWKAYAVALARLRQEPDLSVTAYQTSTSLIRHLFVFDNVWNPDPVIRAPLVGSVLALSVALAMVMVTVREIQRSNDDDLALAALLTATVLLSPVSLDYHYALLILPFGIVLARSQTPRTRWVWLVLAVSAVLMLADLPYTSQRFSDGAWALLAYPKVEGGVLLWGSALWLQRFAPRSTVVTAASVAVAPA